LLKETDFAHQLYSKMVGIADKDWCDIPGLISAMPTLLERLKGFVQSIKRF
jgi:hypothetical protein